MPTDFSGADDIVAARALFRLLSHAEGGRNSSVGSGYRPNHVFEYRSDDSLETGIGEVQFEGARIQPGEERVVTVYFLKSANIVPFLAAGRKWWIHEGKKLVGVGEILELRNC